MLIWQQNFKNVTYPGVRALGESEESTVVGDRDRTREWWLDAHRRYFARQASCEGFEIDETSLSCSSASRLYGRLMSRIRPLGRKSTGRTSDLPRHGRGDPDLNVSRVSDREAWANAVVLRKLSARDIFPTLAEQGIKDRRMRRGYSCGPY